MMRTGMLSVCGLQAHLVTGFDQTKCCFSAQMSRLDDVGFPSRDGLLLRR